MLERLLTTSEVAEILSVTPHAVRKWKDEGKIPYVKIGSTLRFRPEDVRELIESGHTTKQVPQA